MGKEILNIVCNINESFMNKNILFSIKNVFDYIKIAYFYTYAKIRFCPS